MLCVMNDLGCKSVIRGSMTGKPSLLLVEIDGNWLHTQPVGSTGAKFKYLLGYMITSVTELLLPRSDDVWEI